MAEQAGGGPGVAERGVRGEAAEAGRRHTGRQAEAAGLRQVGPGQPHRAQRGHRRQRDPDPGELTVQEGVVAGDVMADQHPAGQQLQQQRRDLAEARGALDVLLRYPVHMGRADRADRVQQGAELALGAEPLVQQHHRHLDHPVPPGAAAGRLHVHHGEAPARGRRLGGRA